MPSSRLNRYRAHQIGEMVEVFNKPALGLVMENIWKFNC